MSVFSAIFDILISNWKLTLTGVAIVSLFGYSSYMNHQLSEKEKEARTAHLRVDSIEAVADTTREIKNLLADSVRYFERRAIQAELEVDSLDEALDRESRVRADVEARVDSLTEVVQSDTVSQDSTETRRAEFNFYREPYTVSADVVMPPPPTPADLSLDVKLDPIPLEFRITCDDNENVNKASLGITTPNWAEIDIQNIQQDPEVCNPSFAQPNLSWFDRNRGKLGLTVGAIASILVGISF